jgi:hypothetical protein
LGFSFIISFYDLLIGFKSILWIFSNNYSSLFVWYSALLNFFLEVIWLSGNLFFREWKCDGIICS